MSSQDDLKTETAPRWLHWLAVATVIATLPLLTLGAEVTTKKAGMVDRNPVRAMWHLFSEINDHGGPLNLMQEKGAGYVIEHAHRTTGWLVGLLVIGLALGLWGFEPRLWLRWAGFLAFVGVLSQGVLGALRVDLDRRLGPSAGGTLALIHGCTAQLVFALLVSIALWTSKAWALLANGQPLSNASASLGEEKEIRRASLILIGVMYIQIVFGAVMRHKELALGTRVHLLMAFVVVGVAVWLGVRMVQCPTAGLIGKRAVMTLGGLLVVQLALGLETLLSKFQVSWYTGERVEPAPLSGDLIRSFHFLVGAMLFSTAVSIALLAHRQFAWATKPLVAPNRHLEGAL